MAPRRASRSRHKLWRVFKRRQYLLRFGAWRPRHVPGCGGAGQRPKLRIASNGTPIGINFKVAPKQLNVGRYRQPVAAAVHFVGLS